MKKQYSKPGIIIEDFAIAQSIAASCGAINTGWGVPGQADKSSCGWDIGGVILWVGESNGCSEEIKEDAEGFGVCYHSYDGEAKIFSS